MVASPAIRDIRKITGLPEKAIGEVLSALTPDGAQEFSQEILAAIAEAQATNDLRPIQTVITSWYRSLLFARQDGFGDALVWARELEIGDQTGRPLDVVRAELGLPKPTV